MDVSPLARSRHGDIVRVVKCDRGLAILDIAAALAILRRAEERGTAVMLRCR